jgi:hypothetical protein
MLKQQLAELQGSLCGKRALKGEKNERIKENYG